MKEDREQQRRSNNSVLLANSVGVWNENVGGAKSIQGKLCSNKIFYTYPHSHQWGNAMSSVGQTHMCAFAAGCPEGL